MLTFLLLALAASQPHPMDAARWTFFDAGARAAPYLGQPSLFLNDGLALVRDSSMGDGTIDVDIAMHGHASFAGIAFRADSETNYELIYVRPHRSRQPDALQYTPILDGSEAWQLYSGPGYTAAAELPANRWVHLRVVVAGYSARVFVDGATEPQLVVTDLKRPWARGRVGLWGRLGGANFANFTFTPASTTAPPAPTPARPAEQLLVDWELSPAFETAKVAPDRLPGERSGWAQVRAEPSGILNIARHRRSVQTAASPQTSRDLVFARATITSVQARRAKLVFGYSDAVHIFLNGRLLYAGESAFRSRDPGFLGIASLGPDALYVDLVPGQNELIFAVTESFGGWGLLARLEPMGPNLGLDDIRYSPRSAAIGSTRAARRAGNAVAAAAAATTPAITARYMTGSRGSISTTKPRTKPAVQ